METVTLILTTLIGTLGAAGIGFVLGWTLYFAIRGRSGELSIAELTAIAGVIAGSVVTAFLDGIGIPEAQRAYIFGGYGLGVLVGFLWYFTLYKRSLVETAKPEDGLALMSLNEVEKVTRSTPIAVAKGSQSFRSTAAHMPSRSDLSAAIKAAEAVSAELGKLRENTTDPNHEDYAPEHATELRALHREVSGLLQSLYLAAALVELNSPELSDLLGTMKAEAAALKKEAGRLKEAAADIASLNETFETLNSLVEKIKAIN